MKRVLITITFLFSIFLAFSQNHMDFKGVQMDGALEDFVKEMEKQGLKYISYKSSPRYAIMKGRFLEFNCEIAISATPHSDKVYMITATTEPFDTSWDALNLNMDYSIRILEQKYGVYDGDYKFLEPYYSGCGDEIKAIKENMLLADLFFSNSNGEVILTINNNCSLYYTYYDFKNRNLADLEYEKEVEMRLGLGSDSN